MVKDALRMPQGCVEQHPQGAFPKRRTYSVNDAHRNRSQYCPSITSHDLTTLVMSDRLTRNHFETFGEYLKQTNQVVCVQIQGARRPLAALATDNVPDSHLFSDGGQCLPLYRYTPRSPSRQDFASTANPVSIKIATGRSRQGAVGHLTISPGLPAGPPGLPQPARRGGHTVLSTRKRQG